MAIQELDEASLLKMTIAESGKAAILFFTPLCGTCKLAERMLEIAEAAGISTSLYKVNINYAPHLRDHWRITSVPCLAVLQDGEPIQFEYAMKSVDHIYLLLK